MPAITCGLGPMLFGRRTLKIVQGMNPCPVSKKPSQIPKASKNRKEKKGVSRKVSSPQSACNIILLMELRKKSVIFRDILDLPPCNTSVSTDRMLIGTMKDLHRFYPESLPHFRRSEFKGLSLDKVLICFCKAMQDLGNASKMSDEWIDKSKYDIYENEKCEKIDKLVEIAVATLNGLIKIAKEKFDMIDEDDENKDNSSEAIADGEVLKDSCSENSCSSSCPSPVTPTSVLHESMSGSPKSSYSSSLLFSLRVQSVGKLNPIDMKRLPLNFFPKLGVPFPSCLNPKKMISEEQKEAKDNSQAAKESIVDKTGDSISTPLNKKNTEKPDSDLNNASGDNTSDENDTQVSKCPPSGVPTPPSSPSVIQSPELASINLQVAEEISITPPATPKEASSPTSPSQSTKISMDMEIDIRSIPPPPPLPPPPLLLQRKLVSREPPLPPPPPPAVWQPNVKTKLKLHTTATEIPSPPRPPPPAARQSNKVATRTTPPIPLSSNEAAIGTPLPPSPPPRMVSKGSGPLPPPPPMNMSKGSVPVPPQPPPPRMASKGLGPMSPPPPPMSRANGAAPPPPPPGPAKSLRPRRTSTKLKRSRHMGDLYRVLRGKLEGCPVQGKSSNTKNAAVGKSTNGKQGMADALAEMTKRSAYFQKIEEDVEKYAKSVTELKTAISKFSTKDMTELLKFHKYAETILEKLTDETQVLARSDGFPVKKLEALRAASVLYTKLESVLTELENWKVEYPLEQLLDRVERYFDKIKGDLDALERTKDEEYKLFKSHNIDFDFQIIVQIKEAMVDVSSNCMELALKEKKDIKLGDNEGSTIKIEAQKKVCTKLLWRAFQFAFRVYTFAGGHDERADKLTREVAQEIQNDQKLQ